MDAKRTPGRRAAATRSPGKRNVPAGSPRRQSASAARFGRPPKASARPSLGRRGKQPAGKGATLAGMARGMMPQGATPASKKGPAALAMAAAGALGGVVLARRRKGGAAPESEAPDTTLHVSSEPVEVAGTGPQGVSAPSQGG